MVAYSLIQVFSLKIMIERAKQNHNRISLFICFGSSSNKFLFELNGVSTNPSRKYLLMDLSIEIYIQGIATLIK